MRALLLGFALITSSALIAQDHAWEARVPDASRTLKNPLAHEKDAAKAGEKLFKHNCAQCHGEHGEGKTGRKVRPPVKSDFVKHASDGELFWLLTNGSVRNGMPAWSELPDAERWQIVSFLRKLNK